MASDKSFWQWIEQRQEAKARLTANRRTLLKGAGAGAIAAAGFRIGSGPSAGAQSAPPYEGVTLRVLTQTGPFISGPVKFHAPEFKEQYGAAVEVVEAPNADFFARAQQAAQSGSGDFDILLLANTWMPDFVNLKYAISLQELIDRDAEDELLAWADIPDGIKRKNSWGGQTYTFIVDNDNQTMFYRKDILGDPKWQEAYNDATGKDLPNPPQTLTEFIEVAKFFCPERWRRGWSEQGDGYGFITCVLRGAAVVLVLLPVDGALLRGPHRQGAGQRRHLHLRSRHEPADQHRGLRARTDRVRRRASGRDAAGSRRQPHAVMFDIVGGTALMSLDWGDTGPASVSEQSVVKGKLGFALTPGVTEYYDWQNKTWVTMPEGEIHRTPTHAYNGWSYYITSQSQNPEAAWAVDQVPREPRDQRDRRRFARFRLPAVAQIA